MELSDALIKLRDYQKFLGKEFVDSRKHEIFRANHITILRNDGKIFGNPLNMNDPVHTSSLIGQDVHVGFSGYSNFFKVTIMIKEETILLYYNEK